MNYEQKYKDALNLARSYYSEDTNTFLDTLFPELRESDEEQTRKDLRDFILNRAGYLLDENTEHRFITYLEKQGQPAWKPSPEHLAALLSALHTDGPCSPGLKSLFDQLKKIAGL